MSYTLNAVISAFIATASKSAEPRLVESVSKDMLVDVSVNTFMGQRNHGKSASRKSFLGGMLWGDQLTFSAVYIKETKQIFLVDGYNRVTRLSTPGGSTMPEGKSALLVTHIVDTVAKATQLYQMFNSLAAAKRSNDAFDSGLRTVGMLDLITSPLVNKGGRATAVQMAYGKKGSRYTTEATVAMADAIYFVDGLGLRKTREIAGQLGAYFAIAKYSPNADLARRFIEQCNMPTFTRSVWTERDAQVKAFRHYVEKKIVGGTGARPNNQVFGVALGYFLTFCLSSDLPVADPTIFAIVTTEPNAEGIALGEFIDKMTKLKGLL